MLLPINRMAFLGGGWVLSAARKPSISFANRVGARFGDDFPALVAWARTATTGAKQAQSKPIIASWRNLIVTSQGVEAINKGKANSCAPPVQGQARGWQRALATGI
ncbi:exported hypothetical protein [Verrucomicrobia bacterium]|nr:exported hypothetical protein [Verrucomicrobiota bacterium]